MPASPAMKVFMNEISSRLKDLTDGNEEMAALALSLLIVEMMNTIHPPAFSKNDIALIGQNCPEVTQEDIKSRALSERGLRSLLSLYRMSSGMIIDYSPLTNCHNETSADTADVERVSQAQAIVDKAYADIVDLGYSTLGAAASLTVIGIETAIQDGACGLKLVRVLNEVMGTCIEAPLKNMEIE
jgi:hypothetical protein